MEEPIPTTEKSINETLFRAIGWGLLFIMVLVGGYYFYHQYKLGQDEDTQAPSTSDLAFAEAQELDPVGASALYKQLAEETTNPNLRARYVIQQAWNSNNAGDYVTGISLLKAVVADVTVPDVFKAEALITMLQLHLKGQQEPLRLIFDDGGIYAEALDGGDINDAADIAVAVDNLYQTADSYHEYAFVSFMRAHMTARYLLSRPSLPEADKELAKSAMVTLLQKGDVLFGVELQSGLYANDQTSIIRDFFHTSMHLRLFALEALAREDESYRAAADGYYDFVMGSFPEFNHAAIRSVKSYIRFYYAAYLADVYGDERNEQIREVIAPVYATEEDSAAVNAYSIWPFIERELSSSTENATIDGGYIKLVASHDPNFAAFLAAQGWLNDQ